METSMRVNKNYTENLTQTKIYGDFDACKQEIHSKSNLIFMETSMWGNRN